MKYVPLRITLTESQEDWATFYFLGLSFIIAFFSCWLFSMGRKSLTHKKVLLISLELCALINIASNSVFCQRLGLHFQPDHRITESQNGRGWKGPLGII